MDIAAPLAGSPDGASGHRPPQFLVLRINPDMAADLLAVSRPGARRNETAISAYAQAMRAGEWVLNGMPLIISRTGLLLDGVQRLHACAEAGVTFITTMAGNVADDTLHTIDRQRRRSFAGVLEARGVAHAGVVANLLAKLIRYDDRTLTRGSSTPPWGRMERCLNANRPEIEQAVAFSLANPVGGFPESVRTPLCYMGLSVDPQALGQFLNAIAEPERFDAGEPGVMIRRRLQEARANPAQRLRAVALFAIAIKALNDTMLRTRSVAYAWSDIARHPRTGEAFPRLAGYGGLSDPGDVPLVGETVRSWDDPWQPEPGSVGGRITLETITPERARDYLTANRGNRAITPAHVAGLARDIRNGEWMFNAQPICFSASGRLLNGQHRLSAVIEAGQPIEVMVMRGLPEAAFETYDKQAKKPPLEGAEDFGDKALIAAAAVLLWKRERRPAGEPDARPTASEVREVVAANPELLALRGFGRKMVRYGRSSAMLYAAHRVLRDDPVLGRVFLDRLETAADLPAGHLILRLRDRLLDLRKADQNAQVDEILAAWPRFRKRPGISLGG
jgi:hypothetical protein